MTLARRRSWLRLGGVAEVAAYLRISKSSLADRRRSYRFPKPLAELDCGPVWDMQEIEAYDLHRYQQHRRSPYSY
jgi:hypothetical protein